MINKVELIGRLTKDPECRYTPDGTCVCNFSIATSESWKDKNTGEKVEKTEFHRIVAWRKLGEICGEWLFKGKLIRIEGKIQTRSWETDGGEKRYSTEIVASDMKMFPDGKRKDGGGTKQEPAPRQDQDGHSSGRGYEPQDEDIPF